MKDLIIIALVLIILAGALFYIIKAKRSGVKCIGCPATARCSRNPGSVEGCSCSSGPEGCGYHADTDEK